jgi:hypothetical protein
MKRGVRPTAADAKTPERTAALAPSKRRPSRVSSAAAKGEGLADALSGTPKRDAKRRNTVHPRGRGAVLAVRGATVCAMTRSAPTLEAVMLSAHAVEQYQQRVKPGLDPAAARFELEQLRLVGRISGQAPGWVNAAKPALYYLLLGDAVVLPLAPHGDGWVATTCVTQLTFTPTRRTAKSARKASLGARKRAQRRAPL